jgi:hypothetical protein
VETEKRRDPSSKHKYASDSSSSPRKSMAEREMRQTFVSLPKCWNRGALSSRVKEKRVDALPTDRLLFLVAAHS